MPGVYVGVVDAGIEAPAFASALLLMDSCEDHWLLGTVDEARIGAATSALDPGTV